MTETYPPPGAAISFTASAGSSSYTTFPGGAECVRHCRLIVASRCRSRSASRAAWNCCHFCRTSGIRYGPTNRAAIISVLSSVSPISIRNRRVAA